MIMTKTNCNNDDNFNSCHITADKVWGNTIRGESKDCCPHAILK